MFYEEIRIKNSSKNIFQLLLIATNTLQSEEAVDSSTVYTESCKIIYRTSLEVFQFLSDDVVHQRRPSG